MLLVRVQRSVYNQGFDLNISAEDVYILVLSQISTRIASIKSVRYLYRLIFLTKLVDVLF